MADRQPESQTEETGRVLQPGKSCWRVEHANRFGFIVDAENYFVAARQAMLQARQSILLLGWDFDPRITFGEPEDGQPESLGEFILWLADRSPKLEIRLLRWDTGALKTLFCWRSLLAVARWARHPRITLRLDGKHPFAGSQHHKIVVIDDRVAFCGGIDMTVGRWDTRQHLDHDPRRKGPDGEDLKPWHDATSVFDGAAAHAVGDLARERWRIVTGETLPVSTGGQDCWPQGAEPSFHDMRLGIARTLPKMDDIRPVHEIEEAYLSLIARARHVIYAESQYFASRKVAHALAMRLVEEDGPEIVVINPVSAEGWLEPVAMDTARARLVEALQRLDRKGRFRLYHPVTEAQEPIYVHAKVTVVDESALRVGSSNFNNRSLRLDTECDVILSTDEVGNEGLHDEILRLRNDLLAEHLGVSAQEIGDHITQTGSLIATIEALRLRGGRTLVPYKMPELSGVEEWLADNEILDPHGPDEIFEAPHRRGLFKGWAALRTGMHDLNQKRKKHFSKK
ncbi:phospholipase D-like domain-containing protein [Acetobacter indonesiensis]|uniref:phospholipase D-like domain-containing protein n=1 Tax=Acetobacter indonesiensis TaxID=104101 RepID=UPI00211AD242|nr:phospholipase D-like domain-containing protein [Acetobacter indonesiensis]